LADDIWVGSSQLRKGITRNPKNEQKKNEIYDGVLFEFSRLRDNDVNVSNNNNNIQHVNLFR
jgi:hypothetical protein